MNAYCKHLYYNEKNKGVYLLLDDKIQFHSRYFFDNTIAPDFFNMNKYKHYPELK